MACAKTERSCGVHSLAAFYVGAGSFKYTQFEIFLVLEKISGNGPFERQKDANV